MMDLLEGTDAKNLDARAKLDRELLAAAEVLLADYQQDQELTAVSVLDAEDFYMADWES